MWRPHPHIGSAQGYLFDGKLCTGDSLGPDGAIRPGRGTYAGPAVGSVHSRSKLPLITAIAAIPSASCSAGSFSPRHYDSDPSFLPAIATLPIFRWLSENGKTVRVVVVSHLRPTLSVPRCRTLSLPALRRRIYLPLYASHIGRASISRRRHSNGMLTPFWPPAHSCPAHRRPITLTSNRTAELCFVGVPPWRAASTSGWNFASFTERRAWPPGAMKAGRFGIVPCDDKEFHPRPGSDDSRDVTRSIIVTQPILTLPTGRSLTIRVSAPTSASSRGTLSSILG